MPNSIKIFICYIILTCLSDSWITCVMLYLIFLWAVWNIDDDPTEP